MGWTSSKVWLINTGSDYDNLMNPAMNPLFVANCEEMYGYLTQRGWSHNAVCAVMGNATYESSVNPGMYERNSGRPVYQSGYGLIQWTDPHAQSEADNPLIAWIRQTFGDDNWQDGDRQCQFINTDDGNNWIETDGYRFTYDQFKVSNESLDYLTRAYFHNRERGTWTSVRLTYAQKISDYFNNATGYAIRLHAQGNCEPYATLHLNDTERIYRAEAGTDVFIHANVGTGDYFQMWTSDYGGAIIDVDTSANTFFTMPASIVDITAHATGETPTPPEPPTPPLKQPTRGKVKKMPIWMYPMFRI